jgi:hypothetical protein
MLEASESTREVRGGRSTTGGVLGYRLLLDRLSWGILGRFVFPFGADDSAAQPFDFAGQPLEAALEVVHLVLQHHQPGGRGLRLGDQTSEPPKHDLNYFTLRRKVQGGWGGFLLSGSAPLPATPRKGRGGRGGGGGVDT